MARGQFRADTARPPRCKPGPNDSCHPARDANSQHRTLAGVYGQAQKLGLKASTSPAARQRHRTSPELDQLIRDGWIDMDPSRKGAVSDLATRLDVPRWWLTKRLTILGLTVRHKKEPRWTVAEDALMSSVPLHQPDKAAAIFREHGFRRSPTAIVVRAKRLSLSRRATRPELSATQAAAILGVDGKFVTARILAGDLPADERDNHWAPSSAKPQTKNNHHHRNKDNQYTTRHKPT